MSTRDILIRILTKGDTKGAEKISNSLDELAKKADEVGKKLTARITTPLAGIALASVFAGTSFDNAFREVTTLIDAPAESIQQLRGDIRKLSTDLDVGLVDTTKAAYNALSAGVPQNNLISFLETAAKTGIAGVASTNESVELLTSLMNTYGIEMTEAEKVSDLLFTTVKNGVTTIPKLGQALGQVAPTASNAGVELEELLATIATITKQTGDTTKASTGLSAAIISLINPSETLNGIYEKLGVSSGRQLIEQRGLAGALNAVAEETKGNDQAFFKALGSVEAYRAAVNLTGENAQKAKGDLNAMAESVGATQSAFEKMIGGSGKALDNLKTSATALLSVIGDGLEPQVIGLGNGLAMLADIASDAPGPLLDIGIAIGAFTAAAPLALVAGAKLITAYKTIASVSPAAAAGIRSVGLAAKTAVPYLAALSAGFALGNIIDDTYKVTTSFANIVAGSTDINQSLDLTVSKLRDQAREMTRIEEKEALISKAMGFRGLAVERMNEAIASGNKEVESQYERQIAQIDRLVASAQDVLEVNVRREIVGADILQQTVELTEHQKYLNSLSEEELALRNKALASIELESNILKAQITGDERRLNFLKEQKKEQQLIEQFKKQGLSGEEAASAAQQLTNLQRRAAEAEERRANAKKRNLELSREELDLEKKKNAELKVGANIERRPDEARDEFIKRQRRAYRSEAAGTNLDGFNRFGDRVGTTYTPDGRLETPITPLPPASPGLSASRPTPQAESKSGSEDLPELIKLMREQNDLLRPISRAYSQA